MCLPTGRGMELEDPRSLQIGRATDTAVLDVVAAAVLVGRCIRSHFPFSSSIVFRGIEC